MTTPVFGKSIGIIQEKIHGYDPSNADGVTGAVYDARQAAFAVGEKAQSVTGDLDQLTIKLDEVVKTVEHIKKAVIGIDSYKDGLDTAAQEVKKRLNSEENITFYRRDLDRLDEVFTEFTSLLTPILDEAQKRGVPVPPLFWFYWQSIQSFIERIDW